MPLIARRWLVLASVVALGGCSKFSSDPSPIDSDAGPDAAPADAGADADTGAPPPPCAGGVHVTNDFQTSLTTGNWTVDGNNHTGTLELVSDGTVSGVASSYLLATSSFSDDTTAQSLTQTIPGRPKHVTLSFTVGLGAMQNAYTEYGCQIFLREHTSPNKSAYLYLHSTSGDPREADFAAEITPTNVGKGEATLGTVAVGAPRRITFSVDLDPDGTVTAAASAVGGKTVNLTPFVSSYAIDETFVQCGISYASRLNTMNPARIEVGVDDVDLTVCP